MNYFKRKILNRLFGGDLRRMIEQNRIPDQETSLMRLKNLGFKPKSVFDIGAYHGDFSKLCLKIWPQTSIIAFEALHEKIEPLTQKFKGRNVKIIEGIIGETDREAVNYYADETASSVLSSDEVNSKKKVVNQKMITLDTFLSTSSTQAPALLKIDTQGYEFQILKGAGNVLLQIEVVLLELNFLEVYHGVKLAHEVMELLTANGFVIYDICEIHRRPLDNALFQIDYIFVKKDSFLRNDKRWGINTNTNQ